MPEYHLSGEQLTQRAEAGQNFLEMGYEAALLHMCAAKNPTDRFMDGPCTLPVGDALTHRQDAVRLLYGSGIFSPDYVLLDEPNGPDDEEFFWQDNIIRGMAIVKDWCIGETGGEQDLKFLPRLAYHRLDPTSLIYDPQMIARTPQDGGSIIEGTVHGDASNLQIIARRYIYEPGIIAHLLPESRRVTPVDPASLPGTPGGNVEAQVKFLDSYIKRDELAQRVQALLGFMSMYLTSTHPDEREMILGMMEQQTFPFLKIPDVYTATVLVESINAVKESQEYADTIDYVTERMIQKYIEDAPDQDIVVTDELKAEVRSIVRTEVAPSVAYRMVLDYMYPGENITLMVDDDTRETMDEYAIDRYKRERAEILENLSLPEDWPWIPPFDSEAVRAIMRQDIEDERIIIFQPNTPPSVSDDHLY